VTEDVSAARYWEAIYEAGRPGWDLGAPAPPLAGAIARGLVAPPARVAVLGAGYGHDALFFARAGFAVTGFDFAAPAVLAARRAAEEAGLAARCRFEQRDIFDLGRERPGAFDLVVEHTCFCAIDPSRRPEYVRVAAAILRPGGRLLGLFYLRPANPTGPPWPAEREEIERLFTREGPFRLLSAEIPADSVERRLGREWLVTLER
jgi:SAM-dependent methyltransferase